MNRRRRERSGDVRVDHRPDLFHEADVALLGKGKGTTDDRQCLFAVAKEEECREECDDDAQKDTPDITHEARHQLSGLAGCRLRGISDDCVEVDTQSSGLALCWAMSFSIGVDPIVLARSIVS